MKNFSKINVFKPSASEYVAFVLISVSIAAFLVLLNKYYQVPRIAFISIWCLVVVFLSLALARSVFNAWAARNLPSGLLFVLLIAMVFWSALKPTSTGFVRHDEIYSWGMWGVQHALGLPADFYYTGAAYPQFFAYEIGSVFLAQGGHVSHFFAKLVMGLPAILALIILCEFTAKSSKKFINWISLAIIVIVFADLINLMFWAYADPLASVLLLTSLSLLLQYDSHPERMYLIVLAIFCGLLASFTKQPGLIWCLFSVPAMMVYGVLRLGWKKSILAPCAIAILVALIWPLFLAPAFTSNQGVIGIMQSNGGVVASFMKSVEAYVLRDLDAGLILIISSFTLLLSKKYRFWWACFVLPYLLIWFTLGSYEKRHGIHVIMISALLLLHMMDDSSATRGDVNEGGCAVSIYFAGLIALGSFFVLLASIGFAYMRHADLLRDGNRVIFVSQFGEDSVEIFDNIISSRQSVFMTSNYQYGALFNRVNLQRPLSSNFNLVVDPDEVKRDLVSSGASFVFTSGEWGHGPYSNIIERLAQQCPNAFELIKQSKIKPEPAIYKIHKNSLASECEP